MGRRFEDLKPKHAGGYTEQHADLCERTLVTLIRGLGPWREAISVVGGLVPRFLIQTRDDPSIPNYAGTMDVDLMLHLDRIAEIEAYRKLEANLKAIGFVRGMNEDGQVQHFRWLMKVDERVTVAVDLLCPVQSASDPTRVVSILGERRLSALALPGAHLVARDTFEYRLTAELLPHGGVTTETVRVANIVPFIVLKALAFEERAEEKDAHDLIYCLAFYQHGPEDVAVAFAERLARWPDEPILDRALGILQARFVSDATTPGARKDGPVAYARFLTEPGRASEDARHRQDATSIVDRFLREVARCRGA